MKKLHGERLKRMMQDGVRASRFTRLSKTLMGPALTIVDRSKKPSPQVVREPTIIGQLSRNTNFDYLGLRDENNKLYKQMNVFLEKNGENRHALTIFTDYMYKINSRLNKTKRILIVTDLTLY
jgi:hypothetical protein